MRKKAMDPDYFRSRMEQLRSGDPEADHSNADRLMCEVLTQLGYGEGVEVFEQMDKWYA